MRNIIKWLWSLLHKPLWTPHKDARRIVKEQNYKADNEPISVPFTILVYEIFSMENFFFSFRPSGKVIYRVHLILTISFFLTKFKFSNIHQLISSSVYTLGIPIKFTRIFRFFLVFSFAFWSSCIRIFIMPKFLITVTPCWVSNIF